MPGGGEAELRQRMEQSLRGSSELMEVLRAARDLALPDCIIFSGAVYQPVLNHLTGRPSSYDGATPFFPFVCV